MPSTITAEKAALRAQIRARLKDLSPSERQASDELLFRRFLALPQVAAASVPLIYHGMGAEPDTARLLEPLWSLGKQVCLPRCLPGNRMEARLVQKENVLVPHPWGMLEPGTDCPLVTQEEIDLVLVPGLAFDRSGGRLGQGGGVYDRWLVGFHGLTAAFCRDPFLLDRVPRESHDRPVDLVMTESGLYGLSQSKTGESGASSPASARDT